MQLFKHVDVGNETTAMNVMGCVIQSSAHWTDCGGASGMFASRQWAIGALQSATHRMNCTAASI